MQIELSADADLLALHAYWSSERGSRAMPRRADINPRKIPSLLPNVLIVEIHPPVRFCFRLAGTNICSRWGQDLTGKWLDELDYDGERASVLEQYAAVVRTGEPRLDVKEFVNASGRYLHYRRLLLPLSEDGHTPNMLLGAQKAIGIDGYQVAVPRWA
jgi:hypothetical protein